MLARRLSMRGGLLVLESACQSRCSTRLPVGVIGGSMCCSVEEVVSITVRRSMWRAAAVAVVTAATLGASLQAQPGFHRWTLA